MRCALLIACCWLVVDGRAEIAQEPRLRAIAAARLVDVRRDTVVTVETDDVRVVQVVRYTIGR